MKSNFFCCTLVAFIVTGHKRFSRELDFLEKHRPNNGSRQGIVITARETGINPVKIVVAPYSAKNVQTNVCHL